jgi:hypothetical protein
VPIYALATGTAQDQLPYQSFKLLQQASVSDFVIGCDTYEPLGELDPERVLNNVFVGGQEPTLAMYQIGGPQHFQTLGKFATYVKAQFTTAVSKAVGSILSNLGVSSRGTVADQLHEIAPCTSALEFEDATRVVERISIDPYGKLVATTDTLGRVLLFDTRIVAAIRVWKGIRDARLAWLETMTSGQGAGTEASPTLCLIIFAPRRSLLSVWAMRHGPCLQTIAVGPSAQLFTIFEHWAGRM